VAPEAGGFTLAERLSDPADLVCGGHRPVQRRENILFSQQRCDAMPVHVGPKIFADPRENWLNSFALQIFEEIAKGWAAE
jgi:hypothetical protein